ncbi:MAG TPA: hypothetical protein VGU43_03920 [Thermoplasmata archaeon]|nr:hypothetical protein [Thermoplasmata archaeon]
MVLLFRRFRRQKTPEPAEEPAESSEPEAEEAAPDGGGSAVGDEPDGDSTASEERITDLPAPDSVAPMEEPDLDSGAAGPIPAPEPTFPAAPPVPPAPERPRLDAAATGGPAAAGPVAAAQPVPATGTGGPPPLPASDESLGPVGEPRGLSSPPANCFLCGTRLEDGRCPKCQMTWIE